MTPVPIRLSAALADRYRLERELGAGGMATVYLAQDIKHDRKVAIKVLRPELAAVIGAERFLSEIKTTANLQHPHILPLFDSGVADSFLFYVMPFVEGESLRDRLTREKQLPIADAVRIATAGVNAMHLDWSTSDTLTFSAREQPLMRVPATGGTPIAVTAVRAPLEVDHHSPRLLPDGNTLLFGIHRQRNRFAVAVQRLDTGEQKVLIEDAFQPTYLPTGHLVFGRGSALLAAPFDLPEQYYDSWKRVAAFRFDRKLSQ